MSNGPVSGNGIPIMLPPGMVIFWNATAQATFSQFVALNDASNNRIFSVEGASTDGHAPTVIGQGFFQVPSSVNGPYMLYLGTNGGSQWSNVIWTNDTLDNGGSNVMSRYIFGSEDGSDNDYNDTFLQMQWFARLG